jgi:hypothetical protein
MDHMMVCHNKNTTVNVIWKKIGDKTGLVAYESPLRQYAVFKPWGNSVSVFETKRAESFDFRGGICIEAQFLGFDCTKVGKMTSPAC